MKYKGNIDVDGVLDFTKARENEVVIRGNTKDIFPDFNAGHSHYLKLVRPTTVHTPNNLPQGQSAQYILVVEQSDGPGFYNIVWSSNYLWAGGGQPEPTKSAGAIDVFTFHVSPNLSRSNKVLGVAAQNLFY